MDNTVVGGYTVEDLLNQAKLFISTVEGIEKEQDINIATKKRLEIKIKELIDSNSLSYSELDVATNAIAILQGVSDEAVTKSYKFIEDSLNSVLEKMFSHTVRKIKLREYTLGEQYPQLEIELIVANGVKRSLKTGSGHGLAQIVSLLCILSLIVLTKSRRIFVMDEIISGLSVNNRMIVTHILWTFTEIGFQFIVNEHGYVPKGAKVYHMEMVNDISKVKETYIEEKGVYWQNVINGDRLEEEQEDYRVVIESDEEIPTDKIISV